MALTTARNLYSRNDMAAVLTAMPMEERRWTLDFLLNLMIVPTEQKAVSKREASSSLECPSENGLGKAKAETKPAVDFRQFRGIIGETDESDKQRMARILHERFDA